MNRKINYCPNCGEKDQKEGARFCWFCGEELPKIGIPSIASQLLDSEENPTSDDIPIDENLKKDKYHSNYESPKIETPSTPNQLLESEENPTSDDIDEFDDRNVEEWWGGVVNTEKQKTYEKYQIALWLILFVYMICVLQIFGSYFNGAPDHAIAGFIALIVLSIIAGLTYMEMKKNKPK